MKIIEGLKKIKDLKRKADDLKAKVRTHSAYLNIETPVYTDQKDQVSEWLQAHKDIIAEILKLRIAIQTTNISTLVAIDMPNGKSVEHSIAEWIHRRRDLAEEERKAWAGLTDRNLKEGTITQSTDQKVDVKIVRCYEPKVRDVKLEEYISEPSIIDSRLEVVNAVTDLLTI